jgi:large subunit ribosomal protein L14
MIIMGTKLDVADNSGAKKASMIGVIGRSGKLNAEIGDIITCNIKESTPTAEVKKGTVVKAVIVRTAYPIKRADGTILRFDSNAVVVIDKDGNPRGTRVFGPVARELRRKKFMKIVSLAPEVI